MGPGRIYVLDQADPRIQYLCERDKRLAKVIRMVGPITYTVRDVEDAYPFLIHEIIEQMLSVKAGNAIFGRLKTICSDNICPETISSLTDEEIRGIGTSNTKVTFIRSITEAVTTGDLDFNDLESMDDTAAMKKLMSIRGIGTWTAKMYLLFVLGRQDILPYEDVAFLQSYQWLYKTADRSPDSVMKKCKKWKPYSSIAARYLYRALDEGYTKEEFHLYK